MRNGNSILALIPARGGSKGVPGKNIRLLGDKPLIAWTIEQARRCPWIDRVIVSTDDPAIADTAVGWGAEVPFLRPAELATDETKMVEVVSHALDWCGQNDRPYEWILLLQPTSPLRDAGDIEAAAKQLEDRGADGVVSVCPCEHSPLWTNTLGPNGEMKDFLRSEAMGNRQGLPTYYRLNGAIYLARSEYFRRCRGFFGDRTFAYIMPSERSIDIDSPLDFQIAEFLVSRTLSCLGTR
jgi:CMP-N,N'-diacetyllegionaminic acid synthase